MEDGIYDQNPCSASSLGSPPSLHSFSLFLFLTALMKENGA